MGFFSSSKTTNVNNTGVLPQDKAEFSSFGTKYFPEYASLLRQTAATPFVLPNAQLALSDRGLTSQQEQAVTSPFAEAINQMFSKVSGQTAQRGFLNPAHTSAVIGSATQNVAPSFANLFANMATQNVNDNLNWQRMLPLEQEKVRQAREAQALNAFGMLPAFLGGSGSGMSEGPGFGQGLTTSLISAVGTAATGNLKP